MQLILAIDTDRRQASQLTALVKGLAVDFVQATSAGEALQALGDRIPDLILTPALLSPFDDGVLAEYLRDLGPAGAHVQTLRIPVLSAPATKASSWSSLFRRPKPTPASSPGCDPKVFAEEINLYLRRAALARQATDTLVGQDPRAWGGASAAWDLDSRRAQEPLLTLPDPEGADTSTWQDTAEWQAADAAAPAAPSAPFDEPDSRASEWDVIEPAVAEEPPVAAGAPDLEAVEASATVDAPLPSASVDKGSPSFEAALAAIRAAWKTPPSRAKADEPRRDRVLSS